MNALDIERGHLCALHSRAHSIFQWLLIAEFAICCVAAFAISPNTWIGGEPSIHPHMIAAFLVGGIAAAGPIYAMRTQPHAAWTVHAVAVSQGVFAGLFVHLTGGRIESHFAYFSLLSLLTFYRSSGPIITATVVIAGDHLLRGLLYPQSAFGMLEADLPRVVEHAAHVIFLDVFLFLGIRHSKKELRERSENELENTKLLEEIDAERAVVESRVEAGIADSRSRAETLDRNVSEITQAVKVVDSGIQRASTLANQMLDAVTDFSQLLDQGGASVRSTTELLAAAEGASRRSAETIGRVQQEASGIHQVTQLIHGIADQTNLLSLNASVEAARAGDAGRGFMVVADEVKQLSRQTVESTDRIEKLANSLGSESARAIEAVEDGRQQVEASLGRSRESLESIEDVLARLDEIRSQVQEVANSNQQIATSSQQVAKRLQTLSS